MDSEDDIIIDNEINENANNQFGLGLLKTDEEWIYKNEYLFDNQDDNEIISLLNNKNINLFGAGNKSQYFPNIIDYKYQIGNNIHNQGMYGTCFAESATLLIEYWLWLRFGKKIVFSRSEIWDLAGDTKGSSYKDREKKQYQAISGGWADRALRSAYFYNDNLDKHFFTKQKNSDNFKMFRDAIDYVYGGIDGSLHTFKKVSITDNMNMDYVRKILLWYGPVCWDCKWTPDEEDSGHSILLYKADQNSLTIRNSHGGYNTNKRFVIDSSYKNDNYDWVLGDHLSNWYTGLDVTFSNSLKKNKIKSAWFKTNVKTIIIHI